MPDTTEYERIAVPMLMVAGANDVLKEPGFAKEIAGRVPNGRLLVYDNCGHAPNIEVADQFNADVLAFLAEVYPAADPAVASRAEER